MGTQVISTPDKLLIIFYPSSKPPHVSFQKFCPHTRSSPFPSSSPAFQFYLFLDFVQYSFLGLASFEQHSVFKGVIHVIQIQFVLFYCFLVSHYRRRQWRPTTVLLPGKCRGQRSLVAVFRGVAKSQTRLSNFTFTFCFHALETEVATHSSILAWRIPGTGEPGGLPSMGSHRVGHD